MDINHFIACLTKAATTVSWVVQGNGAIRLDEHDPFPQDPLAFLANHYKGWREYRAIDIVEIRDYLRIGYDDLLAITRATDRPDESDLRNRLLTAVGIDPKTSSGAACQNRQQSYEKCWCSVEL